MCFHLLALNPKVDTRAISSAMGCRPTFSGRRSKWGVRFPPGTLDPQRQWLTQYQNPKPGQVRTEMRTDLLISVLLYFVRRCLWLFDSGALDARASNFGLCLSRALHVAFSDGLGRNFGPKMRISACID